jgi:hypothetical protein
LFIHLPCFTSSCTCPQTERLRRDTQLFDEGCEGSCYHLSHMLVLVDGLLNETRPYCVRMVQIATHKVTAGCLGKPNCHWARPERLTARHIFRVKREISSLHTLVHKAASLPCRVSFRYYYKYYHVIENITRRHLSLDNAKREESCQ